MGSKSQICKIILLQLLALLLIGLHAKAQDPHIRLTKKVTTLPKPGGDLEVTYSIDKTSEQYEYFLLLTLDSKSSIIAPKSIHNSSKYIDLNFHFPAPLLDLNYGLLLKKEQQIVKTSTLENIQRDCIPKLSNDFIIDDSRPKADKATALLELSQALEQDFMNYDKAIENLQAIIKGKQQP